MTEMNELSESWIVRRKHALRVGDSVTPLKPPRRNGQMVFAPVTGVVAEITKNHIALEVDGREGYFYCFADSVFAVDVEWNNEDDEDDEDD